MCAAMSLVSFGDDSHNFCVVYLGVEHRWSVLEVADVCIASFSLKKLCFRMPYGSGTAFAAEVQ